MNVLNNEEKKIMTAQISALVRAAVSDEYDSRLLSSCDGITNISFLDDVIKDVLETSAWSESGEYSISDLRFAIGRVLLNRLGLGDTPCGAFFGVVRWCDADLREALTRKGYAASEHNVGELRVLCEHHSLCDAMIECGWDHIECLIDHCSTLERE